MKEKLKLVLQAFKVFLLFTGCTILFYYGMMWIKQEYQNYDRYKEPKGAAVKVTADNRAEENTSLFDRLILFYLNGE